MYVARLFFEDRYKDVYLPDQPNWTGFLSLTRPETGWQQDLAIPVRALDGRWYVERPCGYAWSGGASGPAELPIDPSGEYLLRASGRLINIVFAQCERKDTRFRKYALPRGQSVLVGRDEECGILDEHKHISGHHGRFEEKNGAIEYRDFSSNGSYLNGHLISNISIRLQPGDVVAFPTGLKIVSLQGILAINQPPSLRRVGLQPANPPAKSGGETPASIYEQYHRSPRILKKPDVTEIEIEPPLAKSPQQAPPLWQTLGPSSTMILPMLFGSAISGAASGGQMLSSGLVMIGTSSVLAVMWALINVRYQKKKGIESEERRLALYRHYIGEMEENLSGLKQKEYQRLMDTFPNVGQCAEFTEGETHRLWERMPSHADFLNARLGLGRVKLPNPLRTQKNRLSLVDDPLRDEAQRLLDTYGEIEHAPVVLPLGGESVVGILGGQEAQAFAQGLLLQMASLHSYHDVRIAVLSTEGEATVWSWSRWLPHAFANEDRRLRMVVSKPTAIRDVLNHLDEILVMRSEAKNAENGEKDQVPLPHYLVFCTDIQLLENGPIARHLMTNALGMTLVLLAPSLELLPKECRVVLDVGSRPGLMYTSDGDVTEVDYEYPDHALAELFARRLAPVRSKDSVESAAIPTLVTFLDIYGVKNVDDLDVWRFWNENRAYEGLRSVIGLRAGSQPFILDISDKYHGPHGLIAGTTGSGKSVMLETYILSLALNYHPDQVRFILIDYKGGGMAEEFRDLQHVTGIIDNLQGERSIARALMSLQGEIHRREHIFKRVGVNNIDDYIRLFYDDPAEPRLPHLIIVVDEFAELKSEQPDFMRELVSASRVGRSLGVHLILATQKPSNSVSDEIWSNSRFHLCLRVQTRGDSMEMLKRPDAAYIKGMGRCFIQIGNDEIFEQVQTSYSGAAYNPGEPGEDELPHLLTDAGQPVKMRKKKRAAGEREYTQMRAVLDRIARTVREQGLPPVERLWKDELGRIVQLGLIPLFAERRYADGVWPEAEEGVRAVYAMADDVVNQRHVPLCLDLTAARNFLIAGLAGSGKTVAIQTLAVSLAYRYSPERLNLYVFSLSSMSLAVLKALPHVGDVVFGGEEYEQRRLLDLIAAEAERRRALFTEARTDNFAEYNRAAVRLGKETVPAIVVMVDRFQHLTETVGDDDNYTAKLAFLLGEGSGRGIHFIATALGPNEVPIKLRDCFRGAGLQLPERGDYDDVLKSRVPYDMPPIAASNGRGLALMDDRIFEIQIALAGSAEDGQRAKEIELLSQDMCAHYAGRAVPHIPRIPPKPTWTRFAMDVGLFDRAPAAWRLPLAYDLAAGTSVELALEHGFSYLISGARQSGKTNVLKGIARTFAARSARIYAYGKEDWNTFSRELGIEMIPGTEAGWGKLQQDLVSGYIVPRNQARKAALAESPEAMEAVMRQYPPVALLIDNLDGVVENLPQPVSTFLAQTAAEADYFGIYLFATVSHQGYARTHGMLEPMKSLSAQMRGVALGGRLNDCDPWGVTMPFAMKNKSLPMGQAYLIDGDRVRQIVLPLASD